MRDGLVSRQFRRQTRMVPACFIMGTQGRRVSIVCEIIFIRSRISNRIADSEGLTIYRKFEWDGWVRRRYVWYTKRAGNRPTYSNIWPNLHGWKWRIEDPCCLSLSQHVTSRWITVREQNYPQSSNCYKKFSRRRWTEPSHTQQKPAQNSSSRAEGTPTRSHRINWENTTCVVSRVTRPSSRNLNNANCNSHAQLSNIGDVSSTFTRNTVWFLDHVSYIQPIDSYTPKSANENRDTHVPQLMNKETSQPAIKTKAKVIDSSPIRPKFKICP